MVTKKLSNAEYLKRLQSKNPELPEEDYGQEKRV